MAILITQKRLLADEQEDSSLPILYLTAEDRGKARQRLCLPDGREIYLQLPRGDVLAPGDVLYAQEGDAIAVIRALTEPVYTLRAADPFALLRAAYHLGNRHVAVELSPDYLRIKPDHVLAHLLEHLGGVEYVEELAPFVPDPGAFRAHSHAHD